MPKGRVMKAILFSLGSAGWLAAAGQPVPVAGQPPPTPDPTYGLAVELPPDPGPPATNAWIWYGQPEVIADVFFRRSFELTQKPETVHLFVACDDSVVGWVNGRALNGGKPITGYAEMRRFSIKSFLRPGRNVLAMKATNRGGPAGLLVVLLWTDKTGKEHRIESDPRWRATRDAGEDWIAVDYDDVQWSAAQAFGYPPSSPWGVPAGYPGPIPPSFLATLPVDAVRIAAVEPGDGRIEDAENLLGRDGTYAVFSPAPVTGGDSARRPSAIVDFGREIAGAVQVHGRGSTRGRFHVQVGESYGEVTHPAVNAHAWFETTGTLSPRKPIVLRGTAFRFCKLTLLEAEKPVRVDAVTAELRYYPVAYQGRFTCNDPLLTRIWYVAAYTVHLCMREGLWDAPKRDRMEWMGDVHPQQRVIHYAFGDTILLKRTLDRLRGPTPMSEQINGVPGYTMWWIIAQRDLFDFTGDRGYLERRHEKIVATCDWITSELDERHLFAGRRGGWVFLDWGSLSGEESVAGTHMLLVKALADGAYLCRALGDRANAERFEKASQAARRAARRYLRDAKTGAFTTRKQVNALAIFAGVATPAEARTISRTVLAPDDDQIVTPYHNYYVLWARALAGDHAGALDFMRDYWGAMLDAGATSFWEVFDKRWLTEPSGIDGPGPADAPDTHANLDAYAYKGYRISLCHGWSAGPAAWLSAEVLGVRPTRPGFAEIEIRPHLCDLEWAEGNVPTPQGVVGVRHERGPDTFVSQITLPAGTVARVGVPKRRGAQMATRVDGQAEKPMEESTQFADFELKGGKTYRIETKYLVPDL